MPTYCFVSMSRYFYFGHAHIFQRRREIHLQQKNCFTCTGETMFLFEIRFKHAIIIIAHFFNWIAIFFIKKRERTMPKIIDSDFCGGRPCCKRRFFSAFSNNCGGRKFENATYFILRTNKREILNRRAPNNLLIWVCVAGSHAANVEMLLHFQTTAGGRKLENNATY